jgi:hypothetical protein
VKNKKSFRVYELDIFKTNHGCFKKALVFNYKSKKQKFIRSYETYCDQQIKILRALNIPSILNLKREKY